MPQCSWSWARERRTPVSNKARKDVRVWVLKNSCPCIRGLAVLLWGEVTPGVSRAQGEYTIKGFNQAMTGPDLPGPSGHSAELDGGRNSQTMLLKVARLSQFSRDFLCCRIGSQPFSDISPYPTPPPSSQQALKDDVPWESGSWLPAVA